MKSIKGGKRVGAGRKPLGLKKKSVFLYVETRLIFRFGNEEKMKEKLYDFINGYGDVEIPDHSKVFDSPTISNNFQDEPKKWQETQKNPIHPVQNIVNQVQLYSDELREAKNYTQIVIIMESVNGDRAVSVRDRLKLKALADQIVIDNEFCPS